MNAIRNGPPTASPSPTSPTPPARTRSTSESLSRATATGPTITQLTQGQRAADPYKVSRRLVARFVEDSLGRQEDAAHVRRHRDQEDRSRSRRANAGRFAAITSGRPTANGSPTPGPTRTTTPAREATSWALFARHRTRRLRGDRRLGTIFEPHPERFPATASISTSSRNAISSRSTAKRNGTTPTPTWPRSIW